MKVLLDTTRTLPNKFYSNVMRSLLHILWIVWGKELDEEELTA